MKISRDIWLSSFSANCIPRWVCSTCGQGHLELEKETISEKQTAYSHRAMEFVGGSESYHSRFSVILTCSNPQCKECFVVSGLGSIEEEGPNIAEFVEYFRPLYFFPGPLVFPLPLNCPKGIRKPLIQAFGLFLGDPNSAGNKARVVVDNTMTHLERGAGGTRTQAKTLHRRIEHLRKVDPRLASLLEAIKWLGNEGSHNHNLTPNDMLDAFEILYEVIEEVFSDRRKTVDAIADTINSNKGSAS